MPAGLMTYVVPGGDTGRPNLASAGSGNSVRFEKRD